MGLDGGLVGMLKCLIGESGGVGGCKQVYHRGNNPPD